MATFQQNNQPVNPYATMPLYNPDFGFLAKVYGTKQAQYDKGFNMVKSFYSSILNGRLTNENNEQYRQDAFKKIQSTLQSASFSDLSKGQNIKLATSAIDPISTDEDFAYDLIYTRRMDKEKAIMEGYRTSSDPDEREKYNESSAYLMQVADEDMVNARRGTGEIRKVKPVEFVPFENVNKYLNDIAEKQKLEFERTTTKDGYIYTITGGEYSHMAYTDWAKLQMGDRFDRQFQVMGKAQAEQTIRGIMQNKGIDRKTAEMEVATTMRDSMVKDVAKNIAIKENQLKQINNKIDLFENKFTDKELENMPQISESLISLKSAKEFYEKGISKSKLELSDLNSGDISYLALGLPNYLSQEFKSQQAGIWGKVYGDTHIKEDIKADQTYLTKMRLAQDMAFHKDDMMVKAAELDISKRKLDLEIGKAKKEQQGTESFVGYQGSESKLYAVDILSQGIEENSRQFFVTSFGNNGILNAAIPDSTKAMYYRQAATALHDYIYFDKNIPENVLQNLNSLAQDVNVTGNISTKTNALKFLEGLARGVYEVGVKNASTLNKVGAGYKNAEMIEQQRMLFASALQLHDQRSELNKIYGDLADIIEGSIETFKNAKPTGMVTTGGKQIYDLSLLPESQKDLINSLMPQNLQDRIQSKIPTFNFSQLSADEKFLIKNPNVTTVTVKGQKVKWEELGMMSNTDMDEMFQYMTVGFDPTGKKVIINLNPTLTKVNEKVRSIFGTTKPSDIKIEIPYASILENKSNTRLIEHINKYQTHSGVLTLLDGIYENSNAIIDGKYDFVGNTVGYKVQRLQDYQYGSGLNVIMTYYNPEKKANETNTKFFPINDFKNISELSDVEKWIYGASSEYSMYMNNYNKN